MPKKKNHKPSSGRIIAALRAAAQDQGYEDARIELLKGGRAVAWVLEDGTWKVWDCHPSVHALARALNVLPPPAYETGKKLLCKIRAAARKAGYWDVRLVIKRKKGVRVDKGTVTMRDTLPQSVPATSWMLWKSVRKTEDLAREFP